MRLRFIFTHIFCSLVSQIPEGAAVFWDQRIPHANSRSNLSDRTRRVIYGGFLPKVPLNDRYSIEQRRRMRAGLPQSDFWMEGSEGMRELPPTQFISEHAPALNPLLGVLE